MFEEWLVQLRADAKHVTQLRGWQLQQHLAHNRSLVIWVALMTWRKGVRGGGGSKSKCLGILPSLPSKLGLLAWTLSELPTHFV